MLNCLITNTQKTVLVTRLSIVTIMFLFFGCKSPLDDQLGGWRAESNRYLLELDGVDDLSLFVSPQLVPTERETPLFERMEELDALTPVGTDMNWPTQLQTSLGRTSISTTEITLDEAIGSAVLHNLDLKIAKLQPAISHQSQIKAEAAFDFLFGAGASNTRSKIPQQQALIGGDPFGASQSKRDIQSYEASIARKITTGGVFTVSTEATKTDTESIGFTYDPNPSWQSVGTIDFKQPLLRGFGKDVVRSEIKLAKNAERKSIQEFRQTLHKVLTDTETAYLELALQWRTLQVQEWLLQEGEEVVEILELRLAYDTSEADYAQAVATVKKRFTDVIFRQAAVQNASDQLKELMNNPSHAIETNSVLSPVGLIEVGDVYLSLRDTMLLALEKRPDLQELKISVEDQTIHVGVSKNAILPQLDLQAQFSFYGLDSGAGGAYREVFDRDYVNHLVGLSFEYPLGGRSSKSEYKSSRLQRIAAIAAYNRGVQRAIVEVKLAMRDVATSAELIRANRSFRIAQAENLRALLVEEETLGGLTPTFLNLKLQTQAGLANARIAEFTSLVNFNKALASLYMASGTTLAMHQISLDDSVLLDP